MTTKKNKKELKNNIKRSVGRPKLADDKLIKTAKKQILFALLFAVLIISLSGLRIVMGTMPIGAKNNNYLALTPINAIRLNVRGTEYQPKGYWATNITAETVPSNAIVTWSSSNTGVVRITVSKNPKVIRFDVVGYGTAKIKAISSAGQSAYFTIICRPTVKLNVSGTETRYVGYWASNITAVTDPSNATVTWTSSNTKAVKITKTAPKVIKFDVVGAGTAVIKATSNYGASASFTIIGKAKPLPAPTCGSDIYTNSLKRVSGIITAYGSGTNTANGCNIANNVQSGGVTHNYMYYNHPKYGMIRIVAADQTGSESYAGGTVVKITHPHLFTCPIIAIVLDSGGDPNASNGRWFDIRVKNNGSAAAEIGAHGKKASDPVYIDVLQWGGKDTFSCKRVVDANGNANPKN